MNFLPGTLDILILRALRWEPTHGAGIGAWIRLVTGGVFDVEEGTLYPALHRLERAGHVTSEAGRSDAGRRTRHYNLTPAGRKRLQELVEQWETYVGAVARVAGHHRSHIRP
ncbi:MAG: PadR family transcriptional regulator [Gemmatimonadales bacterium]